MLDYTTLEGQLSLQMNRLLFRDLKHQLSNTFGILPVRLDSILREIEESGLPEETSRRLQSQLGAAVDEASFALRFMGAYAHLDQALWSSTEEVQKKVVIAHLLRRSIELLAPIARFYGCQIEFEGTTEQQPVKTLEQRLNLAILYILWLVILWPDRRANVADRIVVSTPTSNTLLIASNCVFQDELSSALNHVTDADSPRSPDEHALLLALKLVEDIGGNVKFVQEDMKSTIAIQIPIGGD